MKKRVGGGGQMHRLRSGARKRVGSQNRRLCPQFPCKSLEESPRAGKSAGGPSGKAFPSLISGDKHR
ncbi:unnamed protein product, partial [Gulo gulo]